MACKHTPSTILYLKDSRAMLKCYDSFQSSKFFIFIDLAFFSLDIIIRDFVLCEVPF